MRVFDRSCSMFGAPDDERDLHSTTRLSALIQIMSDATLPTRRSI
jgi:hypothetical protein